MKKIRLSISVVALGIATFFTACDKDVETSALKIDIDKTGKIKVVVYAELDKSSAGYEHAPAGTAVEVKVDYEDFKTGVEGAWIVIDSLDASGSLTIDVPADENGVTVEVTPQPFEYNQVQSYQTTSQTTVPKFYTAPTTNVTLHSNETEYRSITYNSISDIGGTQQMVLLEGQIVAELNDTVTGREDVMQAVTFTVHNSNFYEDVTTATDGTFSIEVPYNQTIYVTGVFIADRYVNSVGNEEEYEYERDSYSIGSYSSNTDEIDIDFGSGVLVE